MDKFAKGDRKGVGITRGEELMRIEDKDRRIWEKKDRLARFNALWEAIRTFHS